MQIFKTSKAQTIDSGYEPTGAKNAELTDGAEGFFEQDYGSQEPVIPSNPFDALFIGQPQNTTEADGSTAANPFSIEKIVTLEEWLITNKDGKFHLDWYQEAVEKILAKSIQKRDQMREALDNGKVPPHLVPQFLKWLEDSEPYHLALQQEIEKSANKIEEQGKDYLREKMLLQDFNGDGIIGDRNSDDYYIVATRQDGTQVILEKDGKTPAANPYFDPDNKPAFFKDDGSLRQIDPELLDKQPLGEGGLTFDEGFEVTGNTNAYADHFLNAGIDLTPPEVIWVEAVDGKAVVVTDPVTKEKHYNPKPIQIVTREDGTKFFGQEPPTDEERANLVAIKITDAEISSEQVTYIKDSEGQPVDGGYVHVVFKDAKDNPLLRIRIQGKEMPSYSSLVSDGTRYLAASTIGIAVSDGSHIDENGEKVYPKHSSRISLLNLDASRYESTGKTLAADPNDSDSIRQYYEALGIPVQIDDQDRFIGFSHSQKYSNSNETKEEANLRAFNAANETLFGAFVDPAQLYPGNKPTDKEAMKTAEDIKKRLGSGMTAYLPPGERYDENKTGIFVRGIRGVIRGAEKRNNIIIVDPPNDEAIKKMLPYAAEEIEPNSPAYGTVVYGGVGGYNIVVAKGGDAFVENASFFWWENSPGHSDNQVYLDNSEINKEDYEHNKKLFVHIEGPAKNVAIDNGHDLGEQEADEFDKKNASKGTKAELDAYAAKDDWFEVPNITRFSQEGNDLPGGYNDANVTDMTEGDVENAIEEASAKIISDIIRKDPLSEEFFPDIGDWVLSTGIEDMARDAFFEEWEFFSDQEPSMDLEEKEKSKL